VDIGDRYRLLVESLEDVAVYMVDAGGRIESWNRGAERLTGYSRQDAVGMPVTALYPHEQHMAVLSDARSACQNGVDGRKIVGELRCKDGSFVAASITVQPVCDATGTLLG
jgi:PAS domain S-box-containing protein